MLTWHSSAGFVWRVKSSGQSLVLQKYLQTIDTTKMGEDKFQKITVQRREVSKSFPPLFNEKRRCSLDHLQEIFFSVHGTLLWKAFREKHKKPGCKRCRAGPRGGSREWRAHPMLSWVKWRLRRTKSPSLKKKQSEKRAVYANGKSWHKNKKGWTGHE